MLWADKVQEWLSLEVTKEYFKALEADLEGLQQALIQEGDMQTMLRLQGMVRALRGAIDMVTLDGLDEPKEKQDE